MRQDRCEEIREALSDPAWAATGFERLRWIEGLTGVECCIAAGVRHALDARDWRMFDRYVLAAYRQPARAYTDTLCEALQLRTSKLNNDDVLWALDAIRDPASIDCLREVLSWEPDWDEFRWLAIKAIGALAAIGTAEALAVVREATGSSSPAVSEEAERALAHGRD